MSLNLTLNLNLVLHYDRNWTEQNKSEKALSMSALVQDCCMMKELKIPDDKYYNYLLVLILNQSKQAQNKSGQEHTSWGLKQTVVEVHIAVNYKWQDFCSPD